MKCRGAVFVVVQEFLVQSAFHTGCRRCRSQLPRNLFTCQVFLVKPVVHLKTSPRPSTIDSSSIVTVEMITVITKAKQPLLYLLLGAGASVAIQRTIRLLTTNIDRGSKEDASNSMGNGGGVASVSSSSSSSSSNNSKNATNRERKKSALYTKTGDKGTSSLYNGERRLKTDVIFEVLGHQDELNCIIGIAREYCLQSQNGLDEMLSEIQSRLFDLGAAVATPVQTSSAKKKLYTEVGDYQQSVITVITV